MDRLQAVNIMLRHIQQSPVASLSGNKTARTLMAEDLLDRQTKAVQMLSYDFNKLEHYPLYPNEDKEIILPGNVLKVDVLMQAHCQEYWELTTIILRQRK